MPSALIVGGACANCGHDVSTDELLEYLSSGGSNLALYRLIPRSGIKASLDWQGVLGTGADLIAYGTLFWSAYKKYVEPHLKSASEDAHEPFLLITLRGPGHTFAQFAIGRQYTTEEEFQRDFQQQASRLRELDGASDLELQWRFSKDDDWVPFEPAQADSQRRQPSTR